MDRKTLIARTNPPASEQATSHAQTNPSAYGIGQGVEGLGNGIASAGQSLGQIAQIKQAVAARKDQDASTDGLHYLTLASQRADDEYSTKVANNDEELLKIQKSSGSAAWKKARTQQIFSEIASENKWTPPSSEAQSNSFAVLHESGLLRAVSPYQELDIQHGVIRRTDESIERVKGHVETLLSGSPANPGHVLEEAGYLHGIIQQESGTDKNRVGRDFTERLTNALYQVPVPLSATPAQREGWAKQMREYGVTEGFINHYLKAPELKKRRSSSIEAEGLRLAKDGSLTEAVAPRLIAEFVLSGDDPDTAHGKVEALFIEQDIASDDGIFAFNQLNAQQVQQVLALPDTAEAAQEFFRVKNVPPQELTAQLSRLKTHVKSFEKMRVERPEEFAEKRSTLAREARDVLMEGSERGTEAEYRKALDAYTAAVQVAHTDAGYGGSFEADRKFIPTALYDTILAEAEKGVTSPVITWADQHLRRNITEAIAAKSTSPAVVAFAMASMIPRGGEGDKFVDKALSLVVRAAPVPDAKMKAFSEGLKTYHEGFTDPRKVVLDFTRTYEIGSAQPTLDSFSNLKFGQIPSGATLWNMVQGVLGSGQYSDTAANNIMEGTISHILGIAAMDPRPPHISVPDAVRSVATIFASSGIIPYQSNGVQLAQWLPITGESTPLEGLFGRYSADKQDSYANASKSTSLGIEGLTYMLSQGLAQNKRGGLAGLSVSWREFASGRTFGLGPLMNERSASAISAPEIHALLPWTKDLTFDEMRQLQGGSFMPDPKRSGYLVWNQASSVSSPVVGRIGLNEGMFSRSTRKISLSPLDIATIGAYVENYDTFESASVNEPASKAILDKANADLRAKSTNKGQVVGRANAIALTQIPIIRRTLAPYYLNRPRSDDTEE